MFCILVEPLVRPVPSADKSLSSIRLYLRKEKVFRIKQDLYSNCKFVNRRHAPICLHLTEGQEQLDLLLRWESLFNIYLKSPQEASLQQMMQM